MLGLEGNMKRIQAKRTRKELALRPDLKLSVDQMYELVLAETDSRDQAEFAARQYMASQLRAGETPR